MLLLATTIFAICTFGPSGCGSAGDGFDATRPQDLKLARAYKQCLSRFDSPDMATQRVRCAKKYGIEIKFYGDYHGSMVSVATGRPVSLQASRHTTSANAQPSPLQAHSARFTFNEAKHWALSQRIARCFPYIFADVFKRVSEGWSRHPDAGAPASVYRISKATVAAITMKHTGSMSMLGSVPSYDFFKTFEIYHGYLVSGGQNVGGRASISLGIFKGVASFAMFDGNETSMVGWFWPDDNSADARLPTPPGDIQPNAPPTDLSRFDQAHTVHRCGMTAIRATPIDAKIGIVYDLIFDDLDGNLRAERLTQSV